MTSKEGPEGHLPGTRRLSVGEVKSQRFDAVLLGLQEQGHERG